LNPPTPKNKTQKKEGLTKIFKKTFLYQPWSVSQKLVDADLV